MTSTGRMKFGMKIRKIFTPDLYIHKRLRAIKKDGDIMRKQENLWHLAEEMGVDLKDTILEEFYPGNERTSYPTEKHLELVVQRLNELADTRRSDLKTYVPAIGVLVAALGVLFLIFQFIVER